MHFNGRDNANAQLWYLVIYMQLDWEAIAELIASKSTFLKIHLVDSELW